MDDELAAVDRERVNETAEVAFGALRTRIVETVSDMTVGRRKGGKAISYKAGKDFLEVL